MEAQAPEISLPYQEGIRTTVQWCEVEQLEIFSVAHIICPARGVRRSACAPTGPIIQTAHSFLRPNIHDRRRLRSAGCSLQTSIRLLKAVSQTSLTPSVVFAEHSPYAKHPSCSATFSASPENRQSVKRARSLLSDRRPSRQCDPPLSWLLAAGRSSTDR